MGSAATEKENSTSGVVGTSGLSSAEGAAAAATTCLSCVGKGRGSSPGLASAVPTHAYLLKTIMESNQSSSCRRSLDLTLREKYRVARLRTMVPVSLRRPSPGYSMYMTGFWVSSLAREPMRPSRRCASWPGNTVMYRDFLMEERLWMSLQSLRLSVLEGTSSLSELGRTRLTMRASTASSKSARDSFEAAASSAATASASRSFFEGGMATRTRRARAKARGGESARDALDAEGLRAARSAPRTPRSVRDKFESRSRAASVLFTLGA